MIKAHINVYIGRSGMRIASCDHDFADAQALAEVIMMHYRMRNECIVLFEGEGRALTTTLARMDYLDSHFGEEALWREILEAVNSKWRFGQ